MTSTKASFLVLLLAAACAAAVMGDLSMAGTGCANANYQIEAVDAWYQKVTVTFPSFAASLTAGGSTFARATCNMAIPINVPAGQIATLRDISVEGAAAAFGAQPTVQTSYFLAGFSNADVISEQPANGAFAFAHVITANPTSYGQCSKSTIVRVNSALMVSGAASATSSVQLSKLVFSYALQPCGASPDACVTNNKCDVHATCSLAAGVSVQCACNAGYVGDGLTCAAPQAVVAGPAPVVITGPVAAGGNGCPFFGTSTAVLATVVPSADPKSMSLVLQLPSSFGTSPSGTGSLATTTCAFSIRANVLAGHSFSFQSATYPVHTDAMLSAEWARLSSDYFITGLPTAARAFTFNGPRATQDFAQVDSTVVPFTSAASAGTYSEVILRLNVALAVKRVGAPHGASITVSNATPIVINMAMA